jgi:hypothetical protein
MTLKAYRRILASAFLLAVFGISPRPAVAAFIRVELQFPGAAEPILVGVDNGSGFVFSTYFDDNSDGRIELPPISVGDRLALDIEVVEADGHKYPDCLIYTTQGTEVTFGAIFFHPLLLSANGGPLGAVFSQLEVPPIELDVGSRFLVSAGQLPGWNSVRLLDETGVPDFPTFTAVADTLPGFDGEVFVSSGIIRFHVVPEPTGFCLAATGFAMIGLFRMWHTRASQKSSMTQ